MRKPLLAWVTRMTQMQTQMQTQKQETVKSQTVKKRWEKKKLEAATPGFGPAPGHATTALFKF